MKMSLGDYLKQYRRNGGSHTHGSTVTDLVDSRRFVVVWQMMMSGIPLSKLSSTDEDDPDEDHLGRILYGKDGEDDVHERSHSVSFLRAFLEEGQPGLTDVSHLRRDYIPLVRKAEKHRVRSALGYGHDLESPDYLTASTTTWVTLIQDTTPRVDNHWGVVFRFTTSDLNVFEVAVELSKWAELANHEQLMTTTKRLLRTMNVPEGAVILWMGDRCAVNGAAVRRLRTERGGMAGNCSSHTLDLTAAKFYTAELLEFSQTLSAMMTAQGGVNKARRHWVTSFGKEFREPNKIRWWSTEEMWFSWHKDITFARLVDFIRSLPEDEEDGGGDADESGARLQRLTSTLNDPARALELEFELAVNFVTMKVMVETTYILEGARPSLPLIHVDVLNRSRTFYNSHFENDLSYPGLAEVIHSSATDYVNAQPGWIRENRYPAGSLHMQQRTLDEAKENLKAKVRSMLSEVIDTLNSKFFVNDPVTNKPAPCISDVKRALIFRLVNPLHARTLDVAVPGYFRAELEWLNTDGKHEWFSDDDITSMEAEYPTFVQDAKTLLDARDNDVKPVPSMDRIEDFWRFKHINYPALSKLVRFAYTCTASSASVERLFSLLKRTFSLQQMKFALEDYVEGSVMLQFNRKFIRAFPHLA
jgi:hypothetical protein